MATFSLDGAVEQLYTAEKNLFSYTFNSFQFCLFLIHINVLKFPWNFIEQKITNMDLVTLINGEIIFFLMQNIASFTGSFYLHIVTSLIKA